MGGGNRKVFHLTIRDFFLHKDVVVLGMWFDFVVSYNPSVGLLYRPLDSAPCMSSHIRHMKAPNTLLCACAAKKIN